MGDVAMTIPVVYSVCRTYPEKHFMMLTTVFASTLFINPPDNLRVMGVDTNAYRGIGGLRRLSREISDDFAPGIEICHKIHVRQLYNTKISGIFASGDLRFLPIWDFSVPRRSY